MVAPSSASFLRPDLGEAFEEFMPEGYVGLRVYPGFTTALQTANFSVIPVEELLQQRSTIRAPGAGYSRSTFTFEQQNYVCEEYGAEEPVGDRERAIYAHSFDIERVAAQRAVGAVLRELEAQVAAEVNATGTFTNGAAAAAWSNNSSGKPIDDVITGLNSIRATSGLIANTVLMDIDLFRDLQTSDQILDRVKYTWGGGGDPRSVTEMSLAQAFGVDQVIVARSTKNTASQGQTASLAAIFDNTQCWVGRINTGADLREPGAGRVFLNSNDGAGTLSVEQYRDEARRADIIRARLDFDVKTIYSAAGYIVTGCA